MIAVRSHCWLFSPCWSPGHWMPWTCKDLFYATRTWGSTFSCPRHTGIEGMNEGQLGWKTIAVRSSVQLPCLCTARHCLCGSYYQLLINRGLNSKHSCSHCPAFLDTQAPNGALARPRRAKGLCWRLSGRIHNTKKDSREEKNRGTADIVSQIVHLH